MSSMVQAEKGPRRRRKKQPYPAAIHVDVWHIPGCDIARLSAGVDGVEVRTVDGECFVDARCGCSGVYRDIDRLVEGAVDQVDHRASGIRIVGGDRVDEGD